METDFAKERASCDQHAAIYPNRQCRQISRRGAKYHLGILPGVKFGVVAKALQDVISLMFYPAIDWALGVGADS
jgi:hypothetical protein